MNLNRKTRYFIGIIGVSAVIWGGCTAPKGPNHLRKTNHFAGKNVLAKAHYAPPKLRHPGQNRQMAMPPMVNDPRFHKKNRHLRKKKKPGLLAGVFGKDKHKNSTMIYPQFQRWIETEPVYHLYPGDQVDIVVASAPELSRTLTVGPDGRINMPMADPIMAAGKPISQVQQELKTQLAKQLRDPSIAVTPRAYGPQQVYVGGEVGQQGTYTLPGPIGAIEAIFMAGGLRDTAKTKQVAVLRRAPNGGMMMRTVNIGHGLDHIAHYNDVIQLRRGDIIFVPKNRLAEIGVFVQAIRTALPVDFNLSYQLGGNNNNGFAPVITP